MDCKPVDLSAYEANVHDYMNVFFMRKKNGNDWFLGFEDPLNINQTNKIIVKSGNYQRGDILKVLIVSMSTLFIEALQIAIRDKRPAWQVDTYAIQAPLFNQALRKKIKEQCIDVVVIETTNQHFALIIESLKKVKGPEVDIMLLVDSRMGEVYHLLKDEERWASVTKNTKLDEFVLLMESFKSNISNLLEVSLKELDKKILRDLAVGHTFEFIQHKRGMSAEEIDQSLYRINTYFKVPNYIESISKAFEQKIIT